MSAEPGRKTPYSPDIGWRVVWQRLDMEMQFRDIASRLQIANSTAHRIFKHFEESGDVAPRKQPSRPHTRKVDDHHELLIIAIVIEKNLVCTWERFAKESRRLLEHKYQAQVCAGSCKEMVTQGKKYNK